MATHLKPGSSLYFFAKGEIESCGYCGQFAYVKVEEPIKGSVKLKRELYCMHCYRQLFK